MPSPHVGNPLRWFFKKNFTPFNSFVNPLSRFFMKLFLWCGEPFKFFFFTACTFFLTLYWKIPTQPNPNQTNPIQGLWRGPLSLAPGHPGIGLDWRIGGLEIGWIGLEQRQLDWMVLDWISFSLLLLTPPLSFPPPLSSSPLLFPPPPPPPKLLT